MSIEYTAKLKRRASYEHFQYSITYYADGGEVYGVDAHYLYADTRWGARRLAKRMLRRLENDRAPGQQEIIKL